MRRPSSKRAAAIAAAVLVLYAAFGFAAVPWLLKREAPAYAQQHWQRRASLGEVRFNPFTLRLEARDLLLAEADGAPIFAATRLAVEMQWRSLTTRAWRFADIELETPAASLRIAPDGRFNIAELVAAAKRDSGPSTPDDALPRVAIDRIAVQGGRVDMQDRRAGYANTLAPIDFELTGFSTLPGTTDEYRFVARSKRGGVLRWKGRSSVNPIRAQGEFLIEDASLPELSVYLRSQVRAAIAAGKLSATLPYSISYADGRLEARVAGASLAAKDLALAREGATDSFVSLTQLQARSIEADFARQEFSVGEVRAEHGRLALRRDAKGELDLANLMVQSAGPAAAAPHAPAVQAGDWKASVAKIAVEGVAVTAVDETVSPPVKLDVGSVAAQLSLKAAQKAGVLDLQVAGASLALADIAVAKGPQAQKLAHFAVEGAAVDLAARRIALDRVLAEGGRLHVTRDKTGAIDVAQWLPRDGAPAPGADARNRAPQWSATARTVQAGRIAVDLADEQTGIALHIVDAHAQLDGAGTDARQAVKFDAGLALREGGELAGRGRFVPANASLQAQVRARRVALAPLQPLLAQYLKLRIAGGALSAQGKLATGSGKGQAALRYDGSISVDGLAIRELNDDLFASWKTLGAAQVVASLSPNRLEIPELRLAGADAKLVIENDRSFNAARLLVKRDAAAESAAAPAPAAAPGDAKPFPVRIRRLRIEDAKLDFTDLSLRPQFAAKIHELSGAVNGLSTRRTARAQIELDGRVDEFGQARIRGETSLAAPRDSSDVNFVFRNVDMVPASPYSMKFAGYRIAEGRISLDLQYRIRDHKLQGDNRIVIDRLTLGERVDSPEAINIPLELAIAVLKDADGRIDLGLPVSGDLDDPQFSYGAVVWKALGNVLTKIVTAPFRALGALVGGDGAKLEAIDFDAGSGRLQPPEREKLQQVAQVLAKRQSLKLAIPGQYSPAADGAALRALAVRRDVAQRIGIKLAPGEEAGPLDLGDRSVRMALRELYAQRFGDAELDKAKKAAEAAPSPPSAASGPSQRTLPLWQRAAKAMQGEPQVADASAFYRQLRERLESERALPPEALARLGAKRAKAIADALAQGGVDAARFAVTPPQAADSPAGPLVAVKLGLAAR